MSKTVNCIMNDRTGIIHISAEGEKKSLCGFGILKGTKVEHKVTCLSCIKKARKLNVPKNVGQDLVFLRALTSLSRNMGIDIGTLPSVINRLSDELKEISVQENKKEYLVEHVLGSWRGHGEFRKIEAENMARQYQFCVWLINYMHLRGWLNLNEVRSIPLLHTNAILKRD